MEKSGIGDRMKRYEAAYNAVYPIRFPLILRLDGKCFHQMVKKWKCKKPFDENLIEAMLFTAKTLCESISGAQIAYVQSDEINMLIRDDMSIHSQPWFGKEINKVISVSAAKASNAFNYNFLELDCNYPAPTPIKLAHMAEFDCRGFVVPEHEIFNIFLWREQDCTKNSVQMLARKYFSHKQLEGKSNSEMQDMLMLEKKVNWNDLDTHLKRGACIIKKEIPKKVPKRNEKGKVIEGEFETVNRPTWVVDKEIPIFTQNRDYINKYANVCEEQ
jgi:tRNA(His) guanylyltransferase